MAAAQLFNDVQTDHVVIAIPLLAQNVRFFSSNVAVAGARPAFKVQGLAEGGGGGKSTSRNGGGGKGVDGTGSGKQAGESGSGGGDDKLVITVSINLVLNVRQDKISTKLTVIVPSAPAPSFFQPRGPWMI